MKRQAMGANRQSISSVSSLSPSEAIKSGRSLDWDSDTASRKVPLNRRSVSPMAPAFRIGNQPQSRASISSDPSFTPTRSPLHSPPGSAPAVGVRSRLEPHVYSPTPRAPMDSLLAESLKRADLKPVSEAPTPPKQFIASKPEDALTEDTSDSSVQPNVVARQARVRSKKYPQRPANLQIRDTYPKGRTSLEQKTPSPSNNLTVDWPGAGEDDLAITPRASHFHDAMSESTPQRSVSPRLRRPSNARKSSADGQQDGPARKTSSSSNRSRKVSTGSREVKRTRRESAADDGDDEGYDDLLSAYESEDDPRPVSSK
ncbi:hypothetical protein FA13DRAFT_1732736 [Coprinellus micaceus]|uniref:Uncharacterized protein n=1 Tax=Coprinellus micaceus TaxID=71717 RepID=A0A4Y7TAX4_COPMI|nr:hypothetical protein FA13DRAFT_1732736 [Coprinellus micaceus]